MLFAAPTIRITLEQEILFVRPSQSELPSHDPLLRGTLMLYLPRRKYVKAVRMRLEILCDAYGGEDYQYESSKLMQKSLSLDVNDTLEPGEHIFNFNFIIPSSCPVYQRSTHGRVRHFVKATALFKAGTKTSCNPVAFFVSAALSPPDEPPEAFIATVQHVSDDLGPINIQLASPHLTVSSLLHASLLFLSPPRAVSIILISGQISQTFAVYYNDGKVALPPPIRHVMAKVDLTAHHAPLVPTPSRPAHVPGPNGLTNAAAPVDPIRHDPRPLHQLEREQEYTYTTLYRIPTDDLVRPSTLPETNTRIRVTHHLVLEIRYRREGETEDHQLTISRPIVIASCCCLASESSLPPYQATPSPRDLDTFSSLADMRMRQAASRALRISPIRINCLCNTSLEEMFDSEGRVLERVSTLVADAPQLLARLATRSTTRTGVTATEEVDLEEERLRAELEMSRVARESKTAPVHSVGLEGRL